ncbi:hypothetical protein KP13_04439 [Klebsiella pneumoniae subsp. pneumoniae Kp13]|nr:hypothetical protein KP13_04439 [Klebsiella pneumoniae subsp. pneumoniae Kp13]
MPCNLLNHTSHLTANQMKHVAIESFLNEVVLTFIKLYLLLDLISSEPFGEIEA